MGFADVFGGTTRHPRGDGLGVTQVVFTWGQVGAAIRAAKLGFDYSDHQLRRFRRPSPRT